jgi:RIO-like serine/threonine protein kinase
MTRDSWVIMPKPQIEYHARAVLTAEVDDAAVSQFHRKGDGVPEGVVSDHDGVVREVVGRPRRCRLRASSDRVDVHQAEALRDLRRLDEDHVVQSANLSEHEVAGGRVLGDFDELWPISQGAALVRVDEAHVGVAQAGNVLPRQHCHGILHRCW